MAETISETLVELTRQAVERGNPLRLRVDGTSMAPFLLPGDVVIASPVSRNELACGDVLVIQHAHGWVTHRLLRWDERQCWVKGDHTPYADPPISLKAIVSKVTGVERRGAFTNLEKPRWKAVNAWLGRVGLVQAGVAHRLLRRGAEPVWGRNLSGFEWMVFCLLGLPYRALVRLLVWVGG